MSPIGSGAPHEIVDTSRKCSPLHSYTIIHLHTASANAAQNPENESHTVNAINAITAVKTKHEISPQLGMGPFVLFFADAALGLWYVKATTVFARSSQLSPQQTAKNGKGKWKPQNASTLLCHRHWDGL